MKKFFAKFSLKELVLYGVSILIALIGLVFLILGIVADNGPVDSELYKAQGSLPWRYLGFILMGIGAIFAIIVLCVFAKKIDRVTDRELRRKQRLSAMMSDIDKKEEIVVSEGKIVNETKKVEEKEAEVETKPVETPNEVKKEEPVINQPVEESKKEEPIINQPTDNKPSGDQ